MSEIKSIEQVILEEGKLVLSTAGVSMKPLLGNRRDTVIILPVNGRLKKYDVPLYRRGEKCVLHRIVDVLPDSYVICGDNCESYEYDITDDNIIGVLTAFYRKDKYFTVENWCYRLYSVFIVKSFPLRMFLRKSRRVLARIYRKIIPKK